MALRAKTNEKNRPKGGRSRRGESKSFFGLGFWAILIFVVLLAVQFQLLAASRPQVEGRKLAYKTLTDYAETGRIRTARILDQDAYVVGRYERKDGTLGSYNAAYLKTGTRDGLLDLLVENNINPTIEQQYGKSLVTPGTYLIGTLMIIALFGYFFLSWRRGTGAFGVRSGARLVGGSERSETFADVAGQKDAVQELRELVGFLSDSERYSNVGARTPKGVLLYGPPGCGKTLMARAFAGEAGASFYSISGSDFVELYVGVGAARVRELFKEARTNAPSIIFIDELDAVGRSRGETGAVVTSGEQEQALNQILAEMDGFSPVEGIMVLAATNRPDVLDPALLRPGRFDRSIGLERPDEEDRLAILSLHAKKTKLDEGVDMAEIARRAYGMTGADLANVVNEAALLAGRHQGGAVMQADLEQAVKRVIEAPERQRRLSMRTRSIGKRATGIDERVTFADVAGADEAIEEMTEVKDFLVEPERFTKVGAQIPRGILLFGPPGCGKSLLARALAGEVNGAFFSVSGADFVERFVGVGAARVRDLFAEAKAVAPAIVFIDEIDAVGGGRGGGPDGTSDSARHEQDSTLNQILTELDGFEARTGVIVVAATNRPDMLDRALLRPGRFDRHIGISAPDRAGRTKILELHAQSRELEEGVDLDAVSERAHGMTGADLANVVNEAALLAARRHKDAISQAELEEAVKRLTEAPERQRRLSSRQRSVGRRATTLDERITFDDVAGVDDAVVELAEVKDFLAEPERFAEMGVRVPRGILLSGPPGCGKTLLAKAVAGEANAAFFAASATDFVEVWVGQGASRVRDVFAEAKAAAPAILFIDEIDGVGGARSQYRDGNSERESTLNQLLVELDGFEPRTGLIVMAATNRTDMLDPALTRAGRFDRQIEMTLPDRAGRHAILELHARGKRLGADADLDAVASVTPGFSGADLENVINEAGLLAARERETVISNAMVEEAIERVLLGLGGTKKLMSEEEKRIVAYHEAGHALVGLSLEGVSVPHKITIVPRAGSLGYVWFKDEDEKTIHSRTQLINQMAMGFGGRAAEELVIGEPGSGAGEDLARLTAVARRMVCELGMSEALGGVSYSDRLYTDSRTGLPGYSEDETKVIGAEVRLLVDEAHERASRVLLENRAALDRIADALLEHETLSEEELKAAAKREPVGAA